MGSVVHSVFENKDESTDMVSLVDQCQEDDYVEKSSTCIGVESNYEIEEQEFGPSYFSEETRNEKQQSHEGVEERVVESVHQMAACISEELKQDLEVIPAENMETLLCLAKDTANENVVLGQEIKEKSEQEVEIPTVQERKEQKMEMSYTEHDTSADVDLDQENKEESDEAKITTVQERKEQKMEIPLPLTEHDTSEDIDLGQKNKEEYNEAGITTVQEMKEQKMEMPLLLTEHDTIADVDQSQKNKEESKQEANENKQELGMETPFSFDVDTTFLDAASGKYDLGQDTEGECKQETKMVAAEDSKTEQEIEMSLYTEDIDDDENMEDGESFFESAVVQETLSYIKMILATKLPQLRECDTTSGQRQSWREGTLIQRNLYALATGYKSDCSFHIRNGDELWVFPCHVLPLSWASSKLEKMLQETKTHEFVGVEPRHFLKLLEFVYADTTTLEELDITMGVWSVAHDLDVQSLASHCASRVREQVTATDICQVLEFARLAKDPETEQFCMKYIREHTSAVLAADNWSKITRDTLETILSQDELNCSSELELFQACVRWVTASSRDLNAREALGSVLGLIRFRTFSAQDFAISVCPTKLLTDSEQSDIFCCLATNSAKMPAGFSKETKSRGNCVAVKGSVSVAIGTSDFDDTSRPSNTLSTEYHQLGLSSTLSTDYNQPGYASWLNTEYSQPGCSFNDVRYAESSCESPAESFIGNGSENNDTSKVDEISLPVVQGSYTDLKNNGYLGLKQSINLRHARNPVLVQDGHYIRTNPVSFSVNITAYIIHVELFAWRNDQKLDRYKESVRIILESPNGKVARKGKFEGNTLRHKKYRIFLHCPYCLTPNVTYKLYLQFTDLDVSHCGYKITTGKVYKTNWGLQVNILDGNFSQLRAIEFGQRTDTLAGKTNEENMLM